MGTLISKNHQSLNWWFLFVYHCNCHPEHQRSLPAQTEISRECEFANKWRDLSVLYCLVKIISFYSTKSFRDIIKKDIKND